MRAPIAVAVTALLLAGCASDGGSRNASSAEVGPGPELAAPGKGERIARTLCLPGEGPGLAPYDPWERFNRGVYRFNARFDEAIFYPLSRGYRRWVPLPARTGVNNFFSNLGEIGNVVNHALQGRAAHSAKSLVRFLVNTTIGIAGLFDPATPMGLDDVPTGFARTLGTWGVGPGPYFVIPIAGPSSVRDASGGLADLGLGFAADVGGFHDSRNAGWIGATGAVDTRANVNFRYYESGSPFEYETVRFLYSNKRMLESGRQLPSPDECD